MTKWNPAQHPRVPAGRGPDGGEFTRTGGSAAKQLSAKAAAKAHRERVARAKAAYKIAAVPTQVIGAKGEKKFCDLLGIKSTGLTPQGKWHPLDAIIKPGHTHKGVTFSALHNLEIKTFDDNSNKKLTIDKAAMALKVAYNKKHNGRAGVVLIDGMDNFRMFYKPGYGSYRLYSRTHPGKLLMQEFRTLDEFARLVGEAPARKKLKKRK